jgi:hypothetical protein
MHGKIFICHHNQPEHHSNVVDKRRAMRCMGWALVRQDPEAIKVLTDASTALSSHAISGETVDCINRASEERVPCS